MKYNPAESFEQKLERIRRMCAARIYRANPPESVRAEINAIMRRAAEPPDWADPDAREAQCHAYWPPDVVRAFVAARALYNSTPLNFFERPDTVSEARLAATS